MIVTSLAKTTSRLDDVFLKSFPKISENNLLEISNNVSMPK